MGSRRLSKWQRIALRLADQIQLNRLNSAVVELVSSPSKRNWVVAVSGGADSLALLLLVWAHWPDRRNGLILAHFNHRLRGKESGGDANFCRRVAKSLGVNFEVGVWQDPPSRPNESVARDARRSFLHETARRHRATLVWTGHHRDDIAESMIMRLARGSGARGLAAPRPIQKTGAGRIIHVRPLMSLTRSELRAALALVGADWREDSSNSGREPFRNRVRHDVIPAWEAAARRDAGGGAAISRTLLEEEDLALECWLDELDVIDAEKRLRLKSLKGKPRAIWRRALHRWLLIHRQSENLSRQGFEDLLARIQEPRGSRFSLGKGSFARTRRGFLFFEQPSAR